MAVHQSGEDYLETILLLKKKKGVVRSIDIARELNYSKPSVSRAVGILREDGLIVMRADGHLELTDEGKKRAESVYERHKVLTRFLTDILGVPQEIAEEDACKMEHVISKETLEGIKKQLG